MKRFDGRVAVITGGATGMGKVHAEHLASQGARIVIGDLSDMAATEAAVRAHDIEVLSHELDVASENSVKAFADAVMARFGRVDILVNNAGIYPYKLFDDMSFADWRKVMAVNLDGPFLMCKAFLPHMRREKYGRIVNIASAECWMLAAANLHYIASKMGVIGLTRALATETGTDGITVNAVAPGIVANTTTSPQMTKYLEAIPANLQAIKRPAEPIDLAKAVAFFASDEAEFITGQTLVVDGGAVRL